MTTHIKNGLVVEIEGRGEPLLCIHGLGGSSNTWTPLLPALEGHTLVRPDLPGSARSPLGETQLSIDLYVASLEGLLTELDVGPVDIAAHSMGTIVAQHLASRQPSKVRSLALFGPLVAPPEAARPAIRARATLARTGVTGMQEIADAIVSSATSRQTKAERPAVLALVRESVMRQSSEGYAQSCEALADARAATIDEIRIPTLLVTGDQDAVAPSSNVAAMQERIADSRFALLPACGHWTTFEQPGLCMQELENFYRAQR